MNAAIETVRRIIESDLDKVVRFYSNHNLALSYRPRIGYCHKGVINDDIDREISPEDTLMQINPGTLDCNYQISIEAYFPAIKNVHKAMWIKELGAIPSEAFDREITLLFDRAFDKKMKSPEFIKQKREREHKFRKEAEAMESYDIICFIDNLKHMDTPIGCTLSHEYWHLIDKERGYLTKYKLSREGFATLASIIYRGMVREEVSLINGLLEYSNTSFFVNYYKCALMISDALEDPSAPFEEMVDENFREKIETAAQSEKFLESIVRTDCRVGYSGQCLRAKLLTDVINAVEDYVIDITPKNVIKQLQAMNYFEIAKNLSKIDETKLKNDLTSAKEIIDNKIEPKKINYRDRFAFRLLPIKK